MSNFKLTLTADDGGTVNEWVFPHGEDVTSLHVGQEVTQAMHDYETMEAEQEDEL